MSSEPTGKLGASPPLPPIDPKLRRKKLSLVSWMRAGLGALCGAGAGFLNFLSLAGNNQVNSNAYYGFTVAIFGYIVSYYLAKRMLDIGLPPADKNKPISQGIGGFIMLFLFVWILYNTFCVAGYCLTYQGTP